ncbi:hypothetical protein PsorP6_009732 [Peronosclerospora sorghi]|uniref:Uncharacterized protein n=1 Tax=Peronosclerospora sorghi TaxID=230839 RepID=A0ACC0W0E7_9STRA|nr:hypothetical protein PsorP6_009732 [Peronosclerospora sorghi]
MSTLSFIYSLFLVGLVVHDGTASLASTTKSGLLPWVDVATPDSALTHQTSRGQTWSLIMSDEFETPGRSFEAGKDHMWTAMDKPDGVNSALQIYAPNKTGTACDDDTGTCYFYIESDIHETTLTTWNEYKTPPGLQNSTLYYRSGMVQSWNKFCFQGGLVTVRAQLPGITSKASKNPDAKSGSPHVRASHGDFYPTWPGIWLMGNLGRAIFTSSTARMWPFTYNECNETLFHSQNQRISACDANPGSGMNPHQGRGAPEIDIIEGGGTAISASIQIGPGMPKDFRKIRQSLDPDCLYTSTCTETGANGQDVPTAFYWNQRHHKSWYQGLRYGANNHCNRDAKLVQSWSAINGSLTKGITENVCTLDICPASYDVNCDMGWKDNGTDHWSVNTNGTCFAKTNAYIGAYLCNAGNKSPNCTQSGGATKAGDEFEYQMDAVSVFWDAHVGVYLGYVTYSMEWVMGDTGYLRWEVDGDVVFEIPSAAIVDPPQDPGQVNPKKLMIEEPMYFIFNVAISSAWNARPPNALSGYCYGNGTDPTVVALCDEFPLYMKIDYIRVYQDVSDASSMAYGCDPRTHPTKQWIKDHVDDYQDSKNLVTDVVGLAFCRSNDDCTVSTSGWSSVTSGQCVAGRCHCSANSWTGPRCTEPVSHDDAHHMYGPPVLLAFVVAALVTSLTTFVILYKVTQSKRQEARLRQRAVKMDGATEALLEENGAKVQKGPASNHV